MYKTLRYVQTFLISALIIQAYGSLERWQKVNLYRVPAPKSRTNHRKLRSLCEFQVLSDRSCFPSYEVITEFNNPCIKYYIVKFLLS